MPRVRKVRDLTDRLIFNLLLQYYIVIFNEIMLTLQEI